MSDVNGRTTLAACLLVVDAQSAFMSAVTDASYAADKLLKSKLACLKGHQQDQLLALRGMLACNLLQHCLLKRHRVEYGAPR